MAQITAALVKELRDTSGAGMMDCKKALTETDGNHDAAVDWLRTKGLAAAAKKSSRVAAEGLVAVKVEGTKGVAVEVNSETDFVARNEQFQNFVAGVATVSFDLGEDVDALKAATFPQSDKSVEEILTENIATIGENQTIRRAKTLAVDNGAIVAYVHNAVVPNLGKIGVLVALKSDADAETLNSLGKQIAMHIAATNPASLSADDLDPALVEREKQVQMDKARESGKPENIIEKMIVGRMNKYLEEVVLLKQIFVIDNETKICDVIANAAKAAGASIELTGFVRMELGAGIEKKEDDFAAEVASMSQA